MRLAILSDIHSNLEALTKALNVVDTMSVDEIICLGDIVGYGANPNECVEIIRQRCKTVLLGNHDLAAVDISTAEFFTHMARVAAEWTHRTLTAENMQFLRGLPYTANRPNILLVHASPYQPEEWHYILSTFDALEAFKAFEERICFIGHSHVPGIFSSTGKPTSALNKEGRFIINVGSVGQPRDGNPQLSFGVFETETGKYENVREDYDVSGASARILEEGLPRGLADRLFAGV